MFLVLNVIVFVFKFSLRYQVNLLEKKLNCVSFKRLFAVSMLYVKLFSSSQAMKNDMFIIVQCKAFSVSVFWLLFYWHFSHLNKRLID